jgi:peptidoglycan-associated lipoprotein
MALSVRTVLALTFAAGTLTACRKKPEPTPTPAPVQPTPPPAPPTVDDEAARRAAAEAAARAAAAALEAARAALTAPIYFDYDMAELRDDARATLDAKVPVLLANPSLRMRIAGHTDERGSDEYNLALGQRRAAAARRYLEARGVDASRIDIVSFGEERPVAMGGTEAAFAQNRRDEFEVIAGGESLRAPGR